MSPTSSSSTSLSAFGGLHHSTRPGDRYFALDRIGHQVSTSKDTSSTSTMGEYATTARCRTQLDAERGDNCLNTDKERLQKLGYDPVLGRSLNFWSNMFLTLTNMSPVYDIVASITVWGHNGPLLFVSPSNLHPAPLTEKIIGYPFIAVLHLIMLGPFPELASAFPVAGAHASWSWRCARAGIRGERYWGWLMNGFVLAAHLAKVRHFAFGID